MSSRSVSQVALITAGAALTGFVGYAVYFDYQRRNNPQFRKNLRKQAKKIQAAADARAAAEKQKNSAALRLALVEISAEPQPVTPEEQEAYFQEMVAEGEKLATLGPDQMVNSAKAFYRALRVYPQPVELLMIYQKVVPAPIFTLLLELTSLAPGGAESAPPPRPEASVADIDDSSPLGSGSGGEMDSPNGASTGTGSGGDWEKLSDQGVKA